VIHDVDAGLALRMKGPTNVSPARSRIVSPGAAASIAGCSLVNSQPVAQTWRVAADARLANPRQTRHTTTVKRLRRKGTLHTDG
jgi:hypothetical protein